MQKIYLFALIVLSCHAGFVIDSKDATKIAAAITTAALVYVAHELVIFYQPVIVPTQEQRLQHAQAKSKREDIELRDALINCLLKNKGTADVINGIPKKCTDLVNQFLMKAHQEEYRDMLDRLKKLI